MALDARADWASSREERRQGTKDIPRVESGRAANQQDSA
jgi:hypothetical protein